MDGKITRTRFLYSYFYNINMDINFYGQQCYSIHCIFYVLIFISASLSCVQSLTVCDLTNWVRMEGY